MKINIPKILFFLWLLLTPGAPCVAQGNIDSLKKVLPFLKDTARIDCLHRISVYYLLQNSHDSVLQYTNLIYQESQQLNYTHGIALHFTEMAGWLNHKYGNSANDFIEKMAREALYCYGLTGNKTEIEIPLWQLGGALGRQNRYDSAIYFIEQSYQWCEKNKNDSFIFNALGGLYENYRDAGNYDKCFENLQKYQEVNKRLFNNPDTIGELYMLGELNRRIERYDTALYYYRQFIQHIDLKNENIWYRISFPELFALANQFDSAQYYYNQIDSTKLDEHSTRFYMMSLGEFYLLKREYTTALHFFDRALILHERVSDQKEVKRTLLGLAQTYSGLHQNNKALFYARKLLALSVQANAKQFMRDVYAVLYQIFDDKHQMDSAFFYYRKYVAQQELVAGDVVKGKLGAYKYNQQIGQLNNLNAIQQVKLERESFMKKLLIAAIIASIIIGIIIFRAVALKRKNEQQRLAQALQLQKMESEKARAELQQQASELEMQALRSQMNPHFIFNCLNSINRFILKNESEAASDYLTKFSRLIRMVLNHSKKTVILLEDELETLRLYLDLERLRFKNSFDYSISFHNNFDAGSVFIPPLLLQPFAENAIWHGLMHKNSQGLLEIAFALSDQTLNCYITDNGVGRVKAQEFNSKSTEKQKSMGMQITAGRLELLNRNMEQAFFEIEDLYDVEGGPSGTRITLKIKYQDTYPELQQHPSL